MKILVAYASERGATQGVAQRVAGALRDAGHAVDVVPVGERPDVGTYDAVVLGSAVHNQRWLPAAEAFARANEQDLASCPLWLFSVGMPGAFHGRVRAVAEREETAITSVLPKTLRPWRHRLFDGVVRRDHLPPATRLVFHALGGCYGDHRDWTAIDTWARGIAHNLAAAS